ncbi:MAG: TetR/AcrR family transcriptional regulator [Acidobacteriota bacterium]|nr:TetR/AcrR family transcriptional regulator [Acidobacteriota bacterium]
MPRAKEFDPEVALQAAVNLFWRLGYEQTSLELLMQEMKISKQSLYDTFGDKRALYFRAMHHYRKSTNDSLRVVFAADTPVREGLTKIFGSIARETKEQHQRGCLLMSANLSRNVNDAEMTKFLRANQREVERIFAAAFTRARDRGEISADKDPAALARFFVATIQGMRALARLNHDRKELEQISRVALSSLD